MPDTSDEYKIVRNDGITYMDAIDRETAQRIVAQLNDLYSGTYTYRAVKVGE